ncbi:hypothetical protein NQZ68_030772 [Dissostichus eleginoides]|nr:hypothetical protein NQZ68_030772 [Dissostichus eleginoides]
MGERRKLDKKEETNKWIEKGEKRRKEENRRAKRRKREEETREERTEKKQKKETTKRVEGRRGGDRRERREEETRDEKMRKQRRREENEEGDKETRIPNECPPPYYSLPTAFIIQHAPTPKPITLIHPSSTLESIDKQHKQRRGDKQGDVPKPSKQQDSNRKLDFKDIFRNSMTKQGCRNAAGTADFCWLADSGLPVPSPDGGND